jgi:ornithine cyclodeaminase/alanine dehydrogenase-like protein (mu-crystallin family)
MSLLIIRAAEVRDLLPMTESIEVMDRAMRAFSAGEVNTPSRIIAPLNGGKGYFFLMPGEMQSPAFHGAKIIGLYPDNPAQGRPAVQGFVTLFDHTSGAPVALVDGAGITAIRTAAASALATRELSRKDATSHGIFGAGVQAASHLDSVSTIRDIEKVLVWGRDYDKARQFAQKHRQRTGMMISAVEDPAAAAACDIVSLVTNASKPVLRGEWLRAGAHLNLVGAHEPHDREADSEALVKSAIYVDTRQGALSEAGDILIPISEGKISEKDIIGEIGDVLLGNAPGRQDRQQITLYKSLGIVAQDLFAAEHVLSKARKAGKGTLVEFP